MYLRSHADARRLLVSTAQWSGRLLVLESPLKPPAVIAIDESLAMMECFGTRREGLSRIQRILDEVAAALRDVNEHPSIRITLQWCASKVGTLVEAPDGPQAERIRARITRELAEAGRSIAILSASQTENAFDVTETDDMQELLEAFCEEGARVLSEARDACGRADQEAVHALFRAMHTIKGNAGFFGCAQVRDLTHVTENILGALRDSGSGIAGDRLVAVSHSIDLVSAWLNRLEDALESGGAVSFDPAIEEHRRMLQHAFETGAEITTWNRGEAAGGRDERRPFTGIKVAPEELEQLIDVEERLEELVALKHSTAFRAGVQPEPDEILVRVEGAYELLSSTIRSINRVSLAQLFSKVGKLARETAEGLGKVVRVETYGDELEIPRTLVSALSGPMVHLARNAVDHGIEEPSQRENTTKPQLARIEVRASWNAGWLTVEVRDDGRGIDPVRVLQKARSRGLIAEDAVLDEREIFALLTAPGFSTVEVTTEISGRGVGMDVVRKEVERCGGRLDICSTLGVGSSFTILLPETPGLEFPTEVSAPELQLVEEDDSLDLEDAGELTFL